MVRAYYREIHDLCLEGRNMIHEWARRLAQYQLIRLERCHVAHAGVRRILQDRE